MAELSDQNNGIFEKIKQGSGRLFNIIKNNIGDIKSPQERQQQLESFRPSQVLKEAQTTGQGVIRGVMTGTQELGGDVITQVPELSIKATKEVLSRTPYIKDNPKIKSFVNNLQIADDKIDDWQNAWTQHYNTLNKTQAEQFGRVIGRDVLPFFAGAGVVEAATAPGKINTLANIINKIDRPLTRNIVKGALVDIGIQPGMSLSKNETAEEFSFNLGTGLLLGILSDIGIDKLVKKFGRKNIQSVVGQTLLDTEKAIARGALPHEIQDLLDKNLNTFFGKEARVIGLKSVDDSIRKQIQDSGSKKTFAQIAKDSGFTKDGFKNIDELNLPARSIDKDEVNKIIVKLTKGENVDPVVITRRGNVVDGRHTVEAYRALGIDEIPILKKFTKTPIQKEIEKITGLKTTKPKLVKIKPDVELRKKLRIEQSASKKGFAAGVSQARKDVISKLKNKSESITLKRNSLIQYIKASLPKEQHGKFLKEAGSIKTNSDAIRAFRKVDKIANDILKKSKIKSIESIYKNIDKFPVDVQKRIKSILRNIQFTGLTEGKKKQLESLQKIISKEPERKHKFIAAKGIKRLREIERLQKKDINKMSLQELDMFESMLKDEVDTGSVLYKKVQKELELKRELVLNQLIRTSKKVGTDIPSRQLGVEPTVKDKTQLKYIETSNTLVRGDLNFATPDVVFEMLDGNKRFGYNYRTYKQPVDNQYNNFLDRRSKTSSEFVDLEKKLGNLSDSQYERIAIHAMNVQEGGRSKLLKSGLTEKEIDATKLTPKEKRMYDYMRKKLDEVRPEIEDVLKIVHNRDIDKVDNYFPMQTDYNSDKFVLDQLEGDFKKTRTQQGFTKERKLSGKQVLKINARDIFLHHMNNAQYFIEMEKTLHHLGKLARNPKYKQAVGTLGQEYVINWLDVIARKGVPKGYKSNWLDLLNSNIGVAVMGFKAMTALKQPIAKITSGAILGRHTFAGTHEFLRNDVRSSIMQASKQQKLRAFDDPAFQEATLSKKKAAEYAFWALKKLDSLTANSVWYSAYKASFSDRNIKFSLDDFTNNKFDSKAVEYADYVVRRTNGSSEFKDLSRMLSKEQGAAARTILKFQNFLIGTESQLLRHEVGRLGIKKPIDALTILTWLALSGIAEQSVTNMGINIFGSDRAKELNAEESMLSRAAEVAIGKIPFANNIYNGAKYGTSGIPVLDVFWKAIDGAVASQTGTTERSQLRGWVNAVDGVASLLGVPGSGQIAQITKKVIEEKTRTAKGRTGKTSSRTTRTQNKKNRTQ